MRVCYPLVCVPLVLLAACSGELVTGPESSEAVVAALSSSLGPAPAAGPMVEKEKRKTTLCPHPGSVPNGGRTPKTLQLPAGVDCPVLKTPPKKAPPTKKPPPEKEKKKDPPEEKEPPEKGKDEDPFKGKSPPEKDGKDDGSKEKKLPEKGEKTP